MSHKFFSRKFNRYLLILKYVYKISAFNLLFPFFLRPTGSLDSYLECLQKVKSSIDFFTENTGECPELDELVSY